MNTKINIQALQKIGYAIFVIGLLFKIQRWPNTNIFLFSGVAVTFGLAIFHFISLKKKNENAIATLALTLTVGSYFTFKLFHWPYVLFFEILSVFALVGWLMTGGFAKLHAYFQTQKSSKNPKQYFYQTIFKIAFIVTIVGVIFKTMHWPAANIFLIIGMSAAAMSLFQQSSFK